MEVYNEELYPTENYVLMTITYPKNNVNKILYKYFYKKIVKSYKGYFGTWDDYNIYYNRQINIDTYKEYQKLVNKSSNIIKKLIVKNIVREL